MRLASSRRGLSEVIAALLVVSITISAGTLFAVYASGLMGSIMNPTSQPYTEQLTLDYYTWPCPSGSCNALVITVRNDGAASITLSDYFIQGVKLTLASSNLGSNCPTASLPEVLTVQSTCTITFPVTTVTSGVAYIVKLVAKDGTIFTFSCIAGSYTH
jgi:flagellin-like protein